MLKVTNNESRPRVFRTKEFGDLTLLPGENSVEEGAWAEIKKQQWVVQGKKVSVIKALTDEGFLEEGGKEKAATGAAAESIAASGNAPLSHTGGLPGEGGDDITRRLGEETKSAKEDEKSTKKSTRY